MPPNNAYNPIFNMENKLKLKVSRIFRSSCRSKTNSDLSSDQPFFFPENHHHRHQLIELFSPKPPPLSRSFPSFCRPKSAANDTSPLFPRTKITGRTTLLPSPAQKCNRNIYPATPIPHFTTTLNDLNPKPKHRKQRTKSRKTRKIKNQKFDEFFNSVAGSYYGWYSSDDEKEKIKDDDETTFFSSKSMSSDSSESFRKNKSAPAPEKNETNRTSGESDEVMKFCSSGKVKDSYAVIKRSSDPYNDFRTSMVEMIVEKQIFGSKDLENLLQLFLSLNSLSHHRVIIEVFTEIWETLFSDWS